MYVLIVKPGAIGDLLHNTPVIRALKAFEGNASVAVNVGSRLKAQLFSGNPRVDEVIVFDRGGSTGRGAGSSPLGSACGETGMIWSWTTSGAT